MKIEYYHGSIYGNGVMVAEEFKKQMSQKGTAVNIHNIKDARPKEIPPADLYIFSSPGRFGKPARNMQNFLKKANLSPGSKYAVIVTELNPNSDSNSIRIPTKEDTGKCQQVIPIINKILQEKGLVKVAEGKVFVTGIKGPLEEGWQKILEEFVSQIPAQSN
jgi:multimeric flavodoxin WrbA